jgi:uncharacterized protein YdaU (DUF1376 family)
MAPEKAPAFQFYPKDYLSDPRVRAMSFEQRGLYWEAISICWLEGTLPSDTAELAAILGCPLKKFESLWPRIALCFQEHGGRLLHKRLDKERKAQAESRDRRTEAARKRWDKEHGEDALHMQSTTSEQSPADTKQCSPSSSSSASSSSTPVTTGGGPALVMTSRERERLLETHAFVGSKLRVPKVLHSELMTKSGEDADRQLQRWYLQLNDQLEESGKGTGDVFEWLRPRHQSYAILKGWIELAPKPQAPEKKPFSVADALAREAARKAGTR